MSKINCDLSALAHPGAEFAVRVTPNASRNAVEVKEGQIRVFTTKTPEAGKATADVTKLLAKALGVAKTRLILIKGQNARDKRYKLT